MGRWYNIFAEDFTILMGLGSWRGDEYWQVCIMNSWGHGLKMFNTLFLRDNTETLLLGLGEEHILIKHMHV